MLYNNNNNNNDECYNNTEYNNCLFPYKLKNDTKNVLYYNVILF